MRLRISARKSDLARLQAYTVGEALQKKNPSLEIEYRFKESLGDKNLTDPLWKLPEKGVFTEDFYGELINGETDMVVHSWKDLPTELKSDTMIVATLPRADQRDLLLVKKSNFAKIKNTQALSIFSSSPRRAYNLTDFLKNHLPFSLQQVQFGSVRGNIPTRIRKLLETPEVDGLIVAKAALDRLLTAPQAEFAEVQTLLRTYLQQLDYVVLPLSVNPNAAAQGALAVEIAASRPDLKEILAGIDDPSTFACAQKERKILASFGGGCHQKIGVAILQRPYGELTFLKGLTDQGQVLDEHSLRSDDKALHFAESQMWLSQSRSERKVLPFAGLPNETEALFVARSEAWPAALKFSGFVWTAGLKTWKNLAQQGIWVHGSSEGLGEQEEAGLEILAGKKLSWLKLSHREGYESDKNSLPLLATYELIGAEVAPPSEKEAFFWKSGGQFLRAVKTTPGILKKYHACGPGNTYEVIRNYLQEQKAFDPARLRIYLDSEDWRKQCTK